VLSVHARVHASQGLRSEAYPDELPVELE
jgi:hypothetical protein